MKGNMNPSDVNLRLYRAILIAGAALSIISIIGNHISGFPFLQSLKWIALFIVVVTAYIFSSKKSSVHMMFGVFLFILLIFLPFAFIDSGGSNNNALGYTFVLLIAITYLFSGRKRIFLIVLLIVVFITMHALEYFHPEIIAVYPAKSQFVDRMIQIPLLLLASFIFILRFAKEYERVHEQLHILANYDELTGLYNRRLFNSAMEEASVVRDAPVCLALLDLDNFKKLNDKYGHFFGDTVLQELSSILKRTFDFNENTICRWGGDEFAIIYHGGKDELVRMLENVDKAYSAYVCSYDETAGISSSVVSFRDYDSVTELLIAADIQLYGEKANKPY